MTTTLAATSKPKRRFRWLKMLGICAACFVLLRLGQQYLRYQAIQAEVAQYQQELAAAQAAYAELQEQKELLYNDSYLEQLARGSLGMVKAGEAVVMPAEVGDVPELDESVRDQDVNH